MQFRSKTVCDEASGTSYIPFVADDGRVGYRVERDGQHTFLYFNPSDTTGDDTPNVFVYEGRDNDPALDNPIVFVVPEEVV